MKIAVITGASSGMGRDFVMQLDADTKFDEIWAIALEEDLLAQLQPSLRARVRPMAMDLSKPESLQAYQAALAQEKPQVQVLVNASGFGIFKAFEESDLAKLMTMVDVNAKATMALTHMSLPYMQKGGQIYIMGSGSSFQPTPYALAYGASKAFVLSFAQALNMEMEKRGIHVMAVCPLWVRTNFFKTAVSDNTISYFSKWVESADVVKQALKDMKRGKALSILGLNMKLQVLAVKLLPTKTIMKIWCKQQKQC